MDIRKFFSTATPDPKIRTALRVDRHLREPSSSDIEGLTPSQQVVYRQISKGEHTLLTGPAGTGKSYLVQRLRKVARIQGIKMALTAMTGVAAYGIGGSTLHSWAGIGLGDKPLPELIRKISHRKTILDRWRSVDCLVIDEISMMKPELLDTLDGIGRYFRTSHRAFGGIQMILVGDFYQLPPVVMGKPPPDEPIFAFQAKSWTYIATPQPLTEIVRQKQVVFAECLNRVRVGDLDSPLHTNPSYTAATLLQTRVGAKLSGETDALQPTRIYPHKSSAEALNRAFLSGCKGSRRTFETRVVERPARGDHLVSMMQSIPVPERLELAVGAQVILVANLDGDRGLVNGSRGVIEGWNSEGEPIVQFLCGVTEAISPHVWELEPDTENHCRLMQTPLILGWAITVHKSQGMSLDLAEVDVGDTVFECGQAYVALSRVRSLEGLRLFAWNPHRVRVHPEVQRFFG